MHIYNPSNEVNILIAILLKTITQGKYILNLNQGKSSSLSNAICCI